MRWMIEMMMSNGGLAASGSDVAQVLVLKGVREARKLIVLLLRLCDRSGVGALQQRVDIGCDLLDVVVQFGQCCCSSLPCTRPGGAHAVAAVVQQWPARAGGGPWGRSQSPRGPVRSEGRASRHHPPA